MGKCFVKGVMVLAAALLILLTLTAPVPVRASTPDINVNLQINVSWGGGDILNLDITDLDTGERQQVAIRLSDFISEGENVPYILLQAMDLLGERQSGVIQIENPLFDPDKVQTGQTVGNSGSSVGVDELPEDLQNIVAEANEPEPPATLTPDGTGTVVDNIMTVNEIEFFTVTTDDGSDFFLVVDRQRTSNNVYLLNTVTEADLMALAEARGETLPSGSSDTATHPSVPQETPPGLTMEEILQAIQDANEQNQPAIPSVSQSSSGIAVLVAIILFLGGGGFLAWKVLWPKLQSMGQSSQEEINDDEDYDNEYDGDGNGEDDDYSSAYDAVEADEDEDYNQSGGFGGDSSFHEDFEDNRGDADDEE